MALQRAVPRRLILAIAFLGVGAPVLFLFGGDLGRWADDYSFNLRDPVTNEYDFAKTPPRLPIFYRPLFFPLVYTQETVLADSPRALHLPSLLVHALNAVLLGVLLLRLRISAKAAFSASLLFLACPVGWEIPYW